MSSELVTLASNLPALEAELLRRKRNKIDSYYPESGPLRRELYAKHTAFFAAGIEHRERLALAANRVGKTEGIGAYETSLHLTGLYPDWWPGRKFDKQIDAWAAGDTNKTVRDIIQMVLLGAPGNYGTGMIPGDLIRKITTKQGIAEAVDTIYVRHASGGTSMLGLKSYQEGRVSFQGTAKHVVWLDEEPPMDIYIESLMRTMTVDGSMLCTFTPLSGYSDVVKAYLE